MAAPLSIKLYLPDGDPHGLRVLDVGNWNGRALAAPRSVLPDLLAREELRGPGLYCLTGRVDGSKPEAYIGEAETLGQRLRGHGSREFWSQAHVFCSKDDSLNKAHVRFLEGRLIEAAARAGRWHLHNALPGGAKLSEADTAEMNTFFAHVCRLLPLLGCDLLGEPLPTRALLTCAIKGLVARGARSAGGFTIAAGSEAVAEVRDSAATHAPWMLKLRARLIAEGVLVPRADRLVFAREVELASPSGAAALVRGGNANGQKEWRDTSGRTLGEIETAE
jgi:hypothetical protein